MKEQDVEDLIRALMEKAKGGDLKAAKFVTDFLTGGAPAVKLHQHVTYRRSRSDQRHTAAGPAKEDAVLKARVRAARILGAIGPMEAHKIAEAAGISAGRLDEVLASDWFERERDGYRLTTHGRREALGGGQP